jgi:hypothetical protein
MAKQAKELIPEDRMDMTMTMRSLVLDAVKAQNKVDKAVTPVSDKMLSLAKGYQDSKTVGKYNDAAADSFISACSEQESFIRSKEAKSSQVDKLPRCWTQAKSNIKAALIHGLNLKDYTSESALRKDVIKARAAMRKPDAVKSACKALTDALTEMPEEKALEILAKFDADVQAVLQAIVPKEPQKPVDPVTAEIKKFMSKDITEH